MGWTFVFMMLVLKIPICGLGWIVWHAIHDVPDGFNDAADKDAESRDDGGSKVGRQHPRRPLPRSPRRGPHGEPVSPPPARTRSTVAKARHSDRS
jgi:hypothetical protein